MIQENRIKTTEQNWLQYKYSINSPGSVTSINLTMIHPVGRLTEVIQAEIYQCPWWIGEYL